MKNRQHILVLPVENLFAMLAHGCRVDEPNVHF